ncbi:unnamed protein product, partial [Prunus brigantina]
MAINQSNFQQTTQAAISKLEVQLGQIATEIAQREPGKWPSQTVINPKNQEAKAVHVLRSGTIVDNKVGSDLSNDVVIIPAYGKFIKHLITHKLNFAPSEEVKLNKNVSAVLQRKLPPKLEDP